jgi:hypothetical protein
MPNTILVEAKKYQEVVNSQEIYHNRRDFPIYWLTDAKNKLYFELETIT